YHKIRARAQFQATPSLSIAARFVWLKNENPAASVRYDFQSQGEALTLSWTPQSAKRLSVLGEYDYADLRSDVRYLSLPFLSSAVSSYRDHGHTATSSVAVALPRVSGVTPRLEAGGSLFI